MQTLVNLGPKDSDFGGLRAQQGLIMKGLIMAMLLSPLVIQGSVHHPRLLNAGELEVCAGSSVRILGLRGGASWWLWWEFQPPYRPVHCRVRVL